MNTPTGISPEKTVLIIDTDDGARSQLRELLREAGYAAQTFAWAGALQDAALPEAPCCIVVDVSRPSIDGIDLIERLEKRGEPIPVIFTTDDPSVHLSVRAFKAGAVDFLPRPFDDHDMLGAVEHALELDSRRRPIARDRRTMTRRHETLTPREKQVMDGVVRGLLNKQIAWELGIQEITVKIHRSNLMRKMELRSVPDLVRASQAVVPFTHTPAQRVQPA